MRRFALLALLVVGCTTYREDLNRGQRLYEENQYEHALAIWRVLETDTDSLSDNDQARYAYLRGMTDYRLGFRPYARHWLGLARALDKEHPGGLNQEWRDRLDKSLADLNNDVYGGAERFDKSSPGFVEHPADAPAPGPNDAEPSSPPVLNP
ncbi:MAG TPA: hypothetical protein VMI54_22435 [Polyangiaceae bacterium]|nr:hypothetical protein [Polyangiaceae bacterium]